MEDKVTCNGCKNYFDQAEIDHSGFCFECANFDPDPKPDLLTTILRAGKTATERLSKKLGRKIVRESN